MRRTVAVFLVVTLLPLAGCASSAPPPPPPAPIARPAEPLRRLVVVSTGESKFAMSEQRPAAQSSAQVDGIITEVGKWIPGWYGAVLVPLAKVIASALTSTGDSKQTADTAAKMGEVSPRAIVADAFARRLAESGQFQEVRMMDRELLGDERRGVDAFVRLTVPTWGIMRVRDGNPDLLSGFADVRAQMVVATTGLKRICRVARIKLRSGGPLPARFCITPLTRIGDSICGNGQHPETHVCSFPRTIRTRASKRPRSRRRAIWSPALSEERRPDRCTCSRSGAAAHAYRSRSAARSGSRDGEPTGANSTTSTRRSTA